MESKPSKEQMKRIWRFRFTNFFYGCATATVGFNVLLLQSNGMTASQVGFIMSLNSALGALAPPLWGLLADKIRSQYKVFLLSACTAGILCTLAPMSTHVRFFGTILTAVFVPFMSFFRMPGFSMLDAMAINACAQTPGVEFSSVRVWRSIGLSLISMLYSPITAMFGVEIVYYGFGFFILLVLLSRGNLRYFETTVKEKKSVPLKELKVSRIFTSYFLCAFLIANLILQMPSNCNQFLSYLLKDVGVDTSMIGLINGLRNAVNVLVLFAAPYLKRKFSLPAMVICAGICFAAEMLLYQFCSGVVSVALVCMLGGVGLGMNISTGVNYVSTLAPKGLESTCISLYAIGMPLMGIVSNAMGGQIITYMGARAVYLFGFGACGLWLLVYLGSFVVGKRVLHLEPPPEIRIRKVNKAPRRAA